MGNKYGHLIELREDGDDGAATGFRWQIFTVCGDPEQPFTYFAGYDKTAVSPISCPDNVMFDRLGNLWIATDGAPETLGSHDGFFATPVEGTDAGGSRRSSPSRSVPKPPARRCPKTTGRSSSRSNTPGREAATTSRHPPSPTAPGPSRAPRSWWSGARTASPSVPEHRRRQRHDAAVAPGGRCLSGGGRQSRRPRHRAEPPPCRRRHS